MEKSVNETLKKAVEQLFVRVHLDLFQEICKKGKRFIEAPQIVFDPNDTLHVKLVLLCREKIGSKPNQKAQDIFAYIISVYGGAKNNVGYERYY